MDTTASTRYLPLTIDNIGKSCYFYMFHDFADYFKSYLLEKCYWHQCLSSYIAKAFQQKLKDMKIIAQKINGVFFYLLEGEGIRKATGTMVWKVLQQFRLLALSDQTLSGSLC